MIRLVTRMFSFCFVLFCALCGAAAFLCSARARALRALSRHFPLHPPPLKAWHGNDCFARELGRFHGCSYLCFSLSPSVFTSLCRSYSPLLSLSCCFRTIDNNIPEHLSSLVSSLSFHFFCCNAPGQQSPNTHDTQDTTNPYGSRQGKTHTLSDKFPN